MARPGRRFPEPAAHRHLWADGAALRRRVKGIEAYPNAIPCAEKAYGLYMQVVISKYFSRYDRANCAAWRRCCETKPFRPADRWPRLWGPADGDRGNGRLAADWSALAGMTISANGRRTLRPWTGREIGSPSLVVLASRTMVP